MAITPVVYPSGGPSSFGLTDWDDPQTFIAWGSFVISENIREMQAAGLQWQGANEDDLDAIQAAWGVQSQVISGQISFLTALQARYPDSSDLLQRMVDLNYALLQGLDMSAANFRLRQDAIGQQNAALSLLDQQSDKPVHLAQPLEIHQQRTAFPEVLWAQQTAALDEQTTYLQHVKSMMVAKREQLPTESSESVINSLVSAIIDGLIDEAITTTLKFILKWLLGVSNPINAVIAFTMTVAFLWLKDLWDHYEMGQQICQQFIDENTAIRDISIEDADGGTDNDKAWEYYQLREQVITRHNLQIQNLLTEIIALEKQTTEAIGQPTGDSSALVEAVEALSATGFEIDFGDFVYRRIGRQGARSVE